MERRAFLTLIAAAPLAALAPLPKVLELTKDNYEAMRTRDAAAMYERLKAEFLANHPDYEDVIRGRGYVRILSTEGEISLIPIGSISQAR